MITPRPLWLLPPVLTVTGIRNGLPRALPGQPYKLERSALFCSGKCPKAALHALTQHYVAGALAASSALTMSNQPRRGIAILLPASAVTSASFRASLSTRMPARSTSVSHIKGQTPVPARPKKPTLNTRVPYRSPWSLTAASSCHFCFRRGREDQEDARARGPLSMELAHPGVSKAK